MTTKFSTRSLKEKIITILKSGSWQEGIQEIIEGQGHKTQQVLFKLLLHREAMIKWRAIESFGIFANWLLDQNEEKYDDLIRRMIWMTSEESGNIPWGIPESLATIISISEKHTIKFAGIFFSYVYETPAHETNYLDHPPLRTGAWWGILKLSQSYPQHLTEYKGHILKAFSTEEEPQTKALLCSISGELKFRMARERIEKLVEDKSQISVYSDNEIITDSLGKIAQRALDLIAGK